MFLVRSQVRHTGFELTQADNAWSLPPQTACFQNTQPFAYYLRRSPAQLSHQSCQPLPRSVIQPRLNNISHSPNCTTAGHLYDIEKSLLCVSADPQNRAWITPTSKTETAEVFPSVRKLADGLAKGKIDAAFLRRERGVPALAFRPLVKEPLMVIFT
jgi:hypothetical protein